MSNSVNNMLNLIEDVKDNITSGQYKTLLDNLMIIHNNNNNEIKQENNNNDGFINGIFWGEEKQDNNNNNNEDIDNESNSGDEQEVCGFPVLNFILDQEYTAVLTDRKTNTTKEVLVKCSYYPGAGYYYFREIKQENNNNEDIKNDSDSEDEQDVFGYNFYFKKQNSFNDKIIHNNNEYTGVYKEVMYINRNSYKVAVILKKNNDDNNNEIKRENKFIVGNFYPLRIPYVGYMKFINVKCVKETPTFLWFKYSNSNNIPLLKYRKNTDFYKQLNNTTIIQAQQGIDGVILSKKKTKMFGYFREFVRIFINKTDTQYNFNFKNSSHIGDIIEIISRFNEPN